MRNEKHSILYVEDDHDDLYIVQQAFEEYGNDIRIVHASNGVHALKYLAHLPKSAPLPCLIILDMNMPGMDGRETLIRIRQSHEFKHVPVVIFTTSSNQADKEFATKWDADFMTKPLVYTDVVDLAKKFVDKCNFEMSKRA